MYKLSFLSRIDATKIHASQKNVLSEQSAMAFVPCSFLRRGLSRLVKWNEANNISEPKAERKRRSWERLTKRFPPRNVNCKMEAIRQYVAFRGKNSGFPAHFTSPDARCYACTLPDTGNHTRSWMKRISDSFTYQSTKIFYEKRQLALSVSLYFDGSGRSPKSRLPCPYPLEIKLREARKPAVHCIQSDVG